MDVRMLALLVAWGAFGVVWLVGAFRTARTVKRSLGWDRFLVALAVVLGVLALRAGPDARQLGAAIVPASTASLLLGGALLYAGIAFAVWARVHLGRYWSGTVTLKEGHQLIRSGPYAIVRNPIYTGLIAAALGSTILVGRVAGALVVLAIVVAFLLKIRAEEKLLREKFGEEFAAYEREVPRLVPGLW